MTGRAHRAASMGAPFKTYEYDGFEILVGTSASGNDELTLRVARPNDFWLHAAATSGAHVVVRNPADLPRMPRNVLEAAASLAVFHSRGRGGGLTAVHWTQRKHLAKGKKTGQVYLNKYEVVRARPRDLDDDREPTTSGSG